MWALKTESDIPCRPALW